VTVTVPEPKTPGSTATTPPKPPVTPPAPPAWLSLAMARWAPAWVVAGGIAVGVLGDLALRTGLVGVATTVVVAAAAGLLLAGGQQRTVQSRVLVGLAPVFGGWAMVRESEWLLPLDLVAAFGLLLLGVSLSRGGSVADLPFAGIVSRAWHAFHHGFAAPEVLTRVLPSTRRLRGPRTWPVVRGALLAVPLLVLLGVLLGSGDAVFASFVTVDLDVDPSDLIGHLFLTVFSLWVFLWLVRVAGAEPAAPLPSTGVRLGTVEATVVLGSIVALFGAFAVAQLVAVIGGDDYVRRTTGLTYAEYARSGFFQLLWVAALTVAVLLVLRAVTDVARAPRRFAVLFGAVCVLTLLIVAVAVRRLALYQDAFGLTMLRLYCTLFAVWIGVVLVLLAVWLVRRWSRAWFPAAAAVCGLAMLLGLNVVNPEAIVADTNLQREASVDTDTRYVSDLSDDALPTIVELLPTLDPPVRTRLTRYLCQGGPFPNDPLGWTDWNLSRSRAQEIRQDLCLPLFTGS
jgi:two-component system, OmpR family, sensor histidine kinase BaeS